ncbi:MAG: DUF167 domain-containing protein [Planctomycetes bacterium]|nr:DUF167 domain-containing protein [Planctomycetota bacterium]
MSAPDAAGCSAEADGRSVLLSVRIQPGARRAGAAGSWNGWLKLAVAAPPEDGRANEAACALLAELFGLRSSAVELVRGHSARSKIFRLRLAPRAARARLAELLGTQR